MARLSNEELKNQFPSFTYPDIGAVFYGDIPANTVDWNFVEKWGDKLKKVRRDWGWDEVTGEPCKPPENWKEIVSNNDNIPNPYKRVGPTIYIMEWTSKNKMLVTVSGKMSSKKELWQLRDGVWELWGGVPFTLLPLSPDLNKPVR